LTWGDALAMLVAVDITQEAVRAGLRGANYITNERVETAIFLALALEKPLLIEGPAGSGKTEVAKVLAEMLQTQLIRLQCYEGLDEARALYEWNYQKQLLRLQADALGRHLGASVLARIFAGASAAESDFGAAQSRAADR
jgi:MoxR-like ATPase